MYLGDEKKSNKGHNSLLQVCELSRKFYSWEYLKGILNFFVKVC